MPPPVRQPGNWAGLNDPLVVIVGHLVSPQDGFGEIGRMPSGDLRRPNRMSVGVGGIDSIGNETLTRFGTNAALFLRRANGTEAAPSAVLSGEALGGVFFSGFGATAFSGARASLIVAAAENWTDVAQGTELQLATVPIGGTGRTIRWVVQAPGHLVAAIDNVVDIGASGANRPRDIHVARDLLVGNEVETDVIRERTAAAGVTIDGVQLRDIAIGFLGLATPANRVFGSDVLGDAEERFRLHAGGIMQWGDGALARDTNLFRSAANELKTDDNFVIGALSATAISVGVNDSGGAGFKLLRVPN